MELEGLATVAAATAGEPLRYTARAGLLAELSRQTYDSLYKALREAILNGIDARATRVRLDFGRESRDELRVEDDGEGMDVVDVKRSFMSLGGSSKYADQTTFGRIGIGSLALLAYAREARIETKRAGQDSVVEARLQRPHALDRSQRAEPLETFPAGVVTERPCGDATEQHFTRLTLSGLEPQLRDVVENPTALYALLEQLRRVLPLPLGGSRIFEALEQEDAALVESLRAHAATWSVPVVVSSAFHDEITLSRRMFGDGFGETWIGRLQPLNRILRIVRPGERRSVLVAGFLASQRRANTQWSGLTARVQNVAVEEQTFFDVARDPGFRKYITGEVFLLGDLDIDQLIKIDRTSFNRESQDYVLAQRFVAGELESFKRSRVAHVQREKVKIRRVLEERRALLDALQRVAEEVRPREPIGRRGVPSSNNGRLVVERSLDLKTVLRGLRAKVMVDRSLVGYAYTVEAPEQASSLEVRISRALAKPSLDVAGATYLLLFEEGRVDDPPVIIRNRPRAITFNTAHRAIGAGPPANRPPVALALELSYLLPRSDDDAMYRRLLRFLEAL